MHNDVARPRLKTRYVGKGVSFRRCGGGSRNGGRRPGGSRLNEFPRFGTGRSDEVFEFTDGFGQGGLPRLIEPVWERV